MIRLLNVSPSRSVLWREFKECRPWKTLEQFHKEIGKYVDQKEVARLARYVVIQ